MSDDVNFLSQLVRDSMEMQAQDSLDRTEDQDYNVMKPLQVRGQYLSLEQIFILDQTFMTASIMWLNQVRIADLVGARPATSPIPLSQQSQSPDQPEALQISTLRNQTSGALSQVDPTYGSAIQQSDDEECGKGVNYCDLETENGSSNIHSSDKGDIDTLDQSMPCITRTEGP